MLLALICFRSINPPQNQLFCLISVKAFCIQSFDGQSQLLVLISGWLVEWLTLNYKGRNAGSGWRFGVGAMQYRAHPRAFDKTSLQWPRRDYSPPPPRRGVPVFLYFCIFCIFFVFEGSVCVWRVATHKHPSSGVYSCVVALGPPYITLDAWVWFGHNKSACSY